MRFIAILLLAFLIPVLALAGPLEDGKAAYDRGDYQTAVKLIKPLAEQGNAEAQEQFGKMYLWGDGVDNDPAEAMKWFRKAADKGNAEAQGDIGRMYVDGRGVKQDYVRAYMWYSFYPWQEQVDSLFARMTPDQIAEARRLTSLWKACHHLLPAPPAAAKINKTPHFDTLTREQFEAGTVLHTTHAPQEAEDDISLGFSIRLPKGWPKVSIQRMINPKYEIHTYTGLLAKWVSPQVNETPSYLDIVAGKPDDSISKRQWFIYLIRSMGFKLLSMDDISDTRMQGLYEGFGQDHKGMMIVRTVVEIDGSSVVMASFFVPDKRWASEKAMQEKVVNSFQLLNPEKPPAPAEPTGKPETK